MICDTCHYLSKTRIGRVCSYTGEYNPWKKTCPYYKRAEEHFSVAETSRKLICRLAETSPDDRDVIEELIVTAKILCKQLEVNG